MMRSLHARVLVAFFRFLVIVAPPLRLPSPSSLFRLTVTRVSDGRVRWWCDDRTTGGRLGSHDRHSRFLWFPSLFRRYLLLLAYARGRPISSAPWEEEMEGGDEPQAEVIVEGPAAAPPRSTVHHGGRCAAYKNAEERREGRAASQRQRRADEKARAAAKPPPPDSGKSGPHPQKRLLDGDARDFSSGSMGICSRGKSSACPAILATPHPGNIS